MQKGVVTIEKHARGDLCQIGLFSYKHVYMIQPMYSRSNHDFISSFFCVAEFEFCRRINILYTKSVSPQITESTSGFGQIIFERIIVENI